MKKEKWKASYIVENAIWMFGFSLVMTIGLRSGVGFWAVTAMGLLCGALCMVSAEVGPKRDMLPKGVKAYISRRLPLLLLGASLGAIAAYVPIYLVLPSALTGDTVVTWVAVAGLSIGLVIGLFISAFLLRALQKRDESL